MEQVGEKINYCPICGNKKLVSIQTKVSEFLIKIAKIKEQNINLQKCEECSFAFYDYRMTPLEEKRIYEKYRADFYQTMREKSQCWYTKKVNDALNNDVTSIENQKKNIRRMLSKNGFFSFLRALDYGGGAGRTFFDECKEKYVFDISDTEVEKNVKKIKNISNLKFDFVMCNMVLEHLSSFKKIFGDFKEIAGKNTIFYAEVPGDFSLLFSRFSSINSMCNKFSLLCNPNFNNWQLIKYFLKNLGHSPYEMNEHVNFFTKDSLRKLVEKFDFQVIDVQENLVKGVLGNKKVISILFKGKNE